MIICKKCQTEKAESEFSWKIKAKSVRQAMCKTCASAYERWYRASNPEKIQKLGREYYSKERLALLEQKKKYYRENREKIRVKNAEYHQRKRHDPTYKAKIRERALRAKFGLTLEAYKAMAEDQQGMCWICRQAPNRKGGLVVDHCHRTGRVRALLCAPCNSFLGRIKESHEALDRIKEYLCN